jgi:hypothetical protein
MAPASMVARSRILLMMASNALVEMVVVEVFALLVPQRGPVIGSPEVRETDDVGGGERNS